MLDIPSYVSYLQDMGHTYQQRTAERFAQLVATRPITKAHLAEDMGISEHTLRQRLRVGDFRLSELIAAARIFRVSVHDILPNEDAA